MPALEIYFLNVGHGDCTVVRTPGGRVIVIDGYQTTKLPGFLELICPKTDEDTPRSIVSHAIVTHPHGDHYAGIADLLDHPDEFLVERLSLPPFWFGPASTGKPGYHKLINDIDLDTTDVRFVAGYERDYPDGVSIQPPTSTAPAPHDSPQEALCLELLGPPNDIVEEIQDSNFFTPNHLSIVTRISYRSRFSAVVAGDAQMENWGGYLRAGMMRGGCDVLRVAHHGSKNGTQWELIERMAPSRLVVSGDEGNGTHHLPDAVGSVIMRRFSKKNPAWITSQTGTIRVRHDGSGNPDYACFYEGRKEIPDLASPKDPPKELVNMQFWGGLLADRLALTCRSCGDPI